MEMQELQNWMYGVRDYLYTIKENISTYLISLPPEQAAMLSIGAVLVLILFTKICGIVIDAFQSKEVKVKRRKKKSRQNIQIAHGDHTAEHAQAMWDEVNKI